MPESALFFSFIVCTKSHFALYSSKFVRFPLRGNSPSFLWGGDPKLRTNVKVVNTNHLPAVHLSFTIPPFLDMVLG